MLYRAKSLKGYRLKSKDGEIGKVKEFYFDDNHWTIRYLVADTGSWLTGKQVLLSPYALLEVNEEEKYVSVSLTKKQIENSPPLSFDKPVSRQFESDYYGYYGWPTYWTGEYMWGYYPYIARDPESMSKVDQTLETSWDPDLRSTHDVTGRHLEANNGSIGHIADFLIDDETWAIRYLVIDTRNYWPGKKVLISPKWIESLSWEESKIVVNLSKESIKLSPEYQDDVPITREYEDSLYRHYEREAYWKDEAEAKGASQFQKYIASRRDDEIDRTFY